MDEALAWIKGYLAAKEGKMGSWITDTVPTKRDYYLVCLEGRGSERSFAIGEWVLFPEPKKCYWHIHGVPTTSPFDVIAWMPIPPV